MPQNDKELFENNPGGYTVMYNKGLIFRIESGNLVAINFDQGNLLSNRHYE